MSFRSGRYCDIFKLVASPNSATQLVCPKIQDIRALLAGTEGGPTVLFCNYSLFFTHGASFTKASTARGATAVNRPTGSASSIIIIQYS